MRERGEGGSHDTREGGGRGLMPFTVPREVGGREKERDEWQLGF